MIARMQGDAQRLVDAIVELIYFMRGSVSYTEAWNMTYLERDRIQEFITKRIKEESKRQHPVY